MTRIIIVGAAGRMGQTLIRNIADSKDMSLHAAVDRADLQQQGRDVSELLGGAALGVRLTSSLAAVLTGADVVVDFSAATITAANLEACAAAGVPIIVGTTGQAASVEAVAAKAATRCAVLIAANTSLGVTLLADMVERVARALPVEFDIEIVEAHHRDKKDAPSGTALALGRAAAVGREQDLPSVAEKARNGVAPRRGGAIGFAVVRGGDIVGDHTVLFAGPGERLELTHRVTDRAIFARGALQAARWLKGRQPGRYQMSDVISLKSIG